MEQIRFSILGFSQSRVLSLFYLQPMGEGKDPKEVGLDVVDLLILNHIADFPNRTKVKKIIDEDEKVFFWASYNQILKELPLIKIKKHALANRFDKMEKLHVIERKYINVDANNQNATFFRLTDTYESLRYERVGCSIEMQEGIASKCDTPSCIKMQDNNNIIDYDNNIEKEKEEIDKSIPKKKKNPTTQLDLSFIDETFLPIIQDWLDYKREKGQTYKQRGVQALYTRIRTLSGNNATKAKQIVEQSIANNWAGVFGIKQTTQDVVDKYARLTGDRQKVIEESDHTEW